MGMCLRRIAPFYRLGIYTVYNSRNAFLIIVMCAATVLSLKMLDLLYSVVAGSIFIPLRI